MNDRHDDAERDRATRANTRPGAVQRASTLPGNARWRRLFRPAAGATRGLAGVALIILLIAGLGALLESRRGGGFGGGQTPTPRPTATP